MSSKLQNRFVQALKRLPAGADLLRESLADEDKYLQLVTELLERHQAPKHVVADYASLAGLSGGGAAADQLLEGISAWLVAADPQLGPSKKRASRTNLLGGVMGSIKLDIVIS